MELRDYIRVLRAHLLGVVLVTLVVVAVSGIYTFSQSKVYEASSKGLFAPGNPDPSLASVDEQIDESKAATYAQLATGLPVAQRAIDQLHLDSTPAALVGSITVTQSMGTPILVITATAASPAAAQRLADAWVTALAAEVASHENPDGTNTQAVEVDRVSPAALPGAPVSPRTKLNLLAGLVLGLLLALAYAVLRSQLDRRLRASMDIERTFGVPVVARIPAARSLESKKGVSTAGVRKAPGDEGWQPGEAWRKLRTNIAFMDVDNPPRVIVVTSPQAADGKSTTAANLASAIALGGQHVTLVDGDLRRPSVADSFGLVEGAGLTDVLVGNATLDDVLQDHAAVENMSVLAAGSIPPNPSELLGSRAMRNLLAQLGERGMVVVDAPPLLPVTDAAVLTRHSDGAIVVISHGKTLDNELTDALTNLRAVQGHVLGIVFNRIPRRGRGEGYYYASYAAPAGATTDDAKVRELKRSS